jgi:hypothetical protein
MTKHSKAEFGLIGTITSDVITYESGATFKGIGGILYQAAVLCGLGEEVFLCTNCGQEIFPEVEKIIKGWTTLHTQGISTVSGRGNQVRLHYPEKGERLEILESVVPAMNSGKIIRNLTDLKMLVIVLNSAFDIELKEWREIVRRSRCPIWLDIHSLALSKNLGVPRYYRSLPEWKDWAKGVTYLQANKQEVASMLGHPQKLPTEVEFETFSKIALEIGIAVLFITLGKEGVLVLTTEDSLKISAPQVENVVDTTGCGDVFCAGTAWKLAQGVSPFEAASFGIELASKATKVSGVRATHALAVKQRKKMRKETR